MESKHIVDHQIMMVSGTFFNEKSGIIVLSLPFQFSNFTNKLPQIKVESLLRNQEDPKASLQQPDSNCLWPLPCEAIKLDYNSSVH